MRGQHLIVRSTSSTAAAAAAASVVSSVPRSCLCGCCKQHEGVALHSSIHSFIKQLTLYHLHGTIVSALEGQRGWCVVVVVEGGGSSLASLVEVGHCIHIDKVVGQGLKA
jgi:hypothetical protein